LIEEVIATHPAVAECAVIARDDELKGQMSMGLVVFKSDMSITDGRPATAVDKPHT